MITDTGIGDTATEDFKNVFNFYHMPFVPGVGVQLLAAVGSQGLPHGRHSQIQMVPAGPTTSHS